MVHIKDHRLKCNFCFNPTYCPSWGHFHGETAEQPWVELNQLAGSARQMNSGHRMGYLSFHYRYWNWRKV
ncbi:hypothetical protein BDP27DRAFT_1493003, partial [Rhodocollybia butyracea]